MILDELFEADLPSNIKKSDLPPGMRAPLTMRDIEAERPKGPYRYQVGDKRFMDLRAAQSFAAGTGEKVMPLSLEEQTQDPDIVRGMENLAAVEKNANTKIPVYFKNETADINFQVVEPKDKAWIIKHAKEWADAGKTQALYKMMGTNRGFEFLLDAWEQQDLSRSRAAAQQPPEPETADFFSPTQGSAPKSPRMQQESSAGQKKRPDLTEADRGPVTARTQRMMDKVRARQPQARSDLEALAYDLEDQQQRDRSDIERLEKQRDDLERDVKSDLEQEVKKLQQRRGRAGELGAMSGRDTAQDQAIAKIIKLDQEQSKAINDLERAMGQRPRSATGAGLSMPSVPTGEPATKAADADADRFSKAIISPLRAMGGPKEVGQVAPDQTLDITPARTTDQSKKDLQTPGQVAGATATAANQPMRNVLAFRKQAEESIEEAKKRPTPTNASLWSRAKAAAKSKFDVYPSAYANAWAAKWYKAKGGGWRMGKGPKKD